MMTPAPPSPRRATSDQTLALWHEYRRTNDRALRDRLVLTFAPLVKYIVYKKFRELPASCEVEDFISCGLAALLQSIDRYDPSKGATSSSTSGPASTAPFSTNCGGRTGHRAPCAAGNATLPALGGIRRLHGRRPTTAELCNALAITPDELRRHRDAIVRSDVTSLHTLVLSDDETSIERIDTIACSDERLDPEHSAATAEAKEKFRAAFAQLPLREREIAVLLYVKNLTLAEIGEVLGLTESRISQIHTAMKRRLREALDPDAEILRLVA
jgi:RNA polymerase sigma factor for flagellar operon FliA